MNRDMLNLASDLRRAAYWLHDGRIALSKSFLQNAQKKYTIKNTKYLNITSELDKINSLEEGKDKAAERALTLSNILLAAFG